MNWPHIRRRRYNDLSVSIQEHLRETVDELMEEGLSKEEAEATARRRFGNVTLIEQHSREAWQWPFLEGAWTDLRIGVRSLRRSPGFALTAILTLALGIGAVTSVFSIVNTVLLKPFAFRDPDRLVVLREVEKQMRGRTVVVPDSYRHFLRLRKASQTIEDAAIFHQPGASVSPDGDRPHLVGTVAASPNLLRVLGVQPILGRDFVPQDAEKGSPQVVLLTYDGWQTFFHGASNVLGQTLRLGGNPATVIGVLPPGLHIPHIAMAPSLAFQENAGTAETMLFMPMVPNEWDLQKDTGGFNYKVIARLKPGVTLAQASAELEALQQAYTLSARLPVELGASLTPLATDVTSEICSALWLMLAAVGAVLLIACVNLANLQLARAIATEREAAVRAALGASRSQLVRARLAESLVLVLMGAGAGIALAFAGVRLLVYVVPSNIPRLQEVQVNLPVLLFALGVSVATALTIGALPALRSLRVSPQAALQANTSRAANTQEGRRVRNLLVAAEVSCTIILLIITSLVLRSFSHLLRQDRGFDASHVTLLQVDLYAPQYTDDRANVKAAKLAFADRARTVLEQLPGVQSVAITSAVPLTGETWVDGLIRPDHPVPEAQQPPVNVRWIDQNYLATMQIPLVAGRNLTASDRANPYVALISQRTAREGFPGENPIGRTISSIVPDDEHAVTVVGVVADTRINGLKDTAAMLYAPYWAYTPWTLSFFVRSAQTDQALIPEIRRAIWNVDAQVAIPVLKSMEDQVSDSVATDRFQAVVLTSFGAAALLLALLGIYGVLAYSVSLRQQEFGIRIALGSGKAALIQLVLRQAAYPVLLGAGAGLTLAFVALRWVRTLLYETPALDPIAIGGSVLVLLATAALAAWMPARRAASIDPIQTLRNE